MHFKTLSTVADCTVAQNNALCRAFYIEIIFEILLFQCEYKKLVKLFEPLQLKFGPKFAISSEMLRVSSGKVSPCNESISRVACESKRDSVGGVPGGEDGGGGNGGGNEGGKRRGSEIEYDVLVV